jgi:hypothetical protein
LKFLAFRDRNDYEESVGKRWVEENVPDWHSDQDDVLHLKNLKGAFIVLFFGTILSTAVWLREMMHGAALQKVFYKLIRKLILVGLITIK